MSTLTIRGKKLGRAVDPRNPEAKELEQGIIIPIYNVVPFTNLYKEEKVETLKFE